MSTPQPSTPQQPWALPAPPSPSPPVREALPRRPLLSTPLGLFMAVFALVVLLGLAALTYVLVQRNRTPVVHLPTPLMPKPNAFDLYVKAGKEMVRKDDIGEATSATAKRKWTMADKAALVAANREPLTVFRSGFGLPYRDRPMRSIRQLFPYYADFRNAARLMRIEAQVKQAAGDNVGAAASGLDAVQLGRQISAGAPLIGGLVSIACQAIGRQAVWNSCEGLNGPQAKAAARRLERLRQTGATTADILTEEKYATQAVVLELFRDPDAFVQETNPPAATSKLKTTDKPKMTDKSKATIEPKEESDDSGMTAGAWRFIFLLYGKQRIFDNVSGHMDKLIAQGKRRYGADPAPLPEPNDPLSQTLLPVFTQARFKFVLSDTENALLTADLALRAYKGERGSYPPALDALVPAYLSHIPDDLFAAAGPLRYRRTTNGFLLYSVGPDGENDNGAPIENPDAKTAREKRQTKEGSLGDIVAGVNM